MPLTDGGTRPVPDARPSIPAAHTPVPVAHDPVPVAPEGSVPPARLGEIVGSLSRSQRISVGAIVFASVLLAGTGLYLSFEHVAAFAHDRLRFQTLGKAQLFTLGVDLGILVLIAIDLVMAWLRRPIGWVRFPVWLLTGATIVLNGASAAPEAGAAWTGTDYVAVFAHTVVAFLFIVIVEVAKTAINRAVRPATDDQEQTGVPASRWFLSPGRTFILWRSMKLWDTDYFEAMERAQAIHVYRVHLERRYGRGWRRKAPADLRLPLTMAPYGLTIEEALDLPRQAAEREAVLKEAQEAERVAAATRAADRDADAKIARLRTDGRVKAAEHEVEVVTTQAAIAARAELTAAERAAEAEVTALESVAAAEADARRAEAEKSAAEAREAAAEIEDRAAGTAERAAETRRRAAEIEAQAAAAEATAESARRRREEDAERAAEAAARAAETRLRIAEIEGRAAEVEDEARLNQKDRNVLRLARMALLEHGGEVDAIPLETVAAVFDVSTTTASNYRKWAAERIAEGYRPEGI
ncbi:DUF2637 domain-containing protein [Streptomyces sp. NBC_01568]|uniref:DUF2637 domain-containing protein n=1 Tax=Streptomyces sp. NBC_01568 TaxID=2975882 RepID=UPI002F91A538